MGQPITSTRNPRVVDARKLTQKKHRMAQNRFAAAGLQILGMAIEGMTHCHMQGSICPIDVFYCVELFATQTAPRILEQLLDAGATGIPVSQRVLETLSDRELSQGLVATFAIDDLLFDIEQIPRPARLQPHLVVVLDRPQYPGNAGTLIRTADAIGAGAVILVEPAVDPFAPRSIRSSMGSIFAIPIARTADIGALRAWGQESEIQWVGADASEGELVWGSPALEGSVGLILGNEGDGLQSALEEMIDHRIRLPQRGGAESLNVAVAGGVLMYEWLRINHPEAAGGC